MRNPQPLDVNKENFSIKFFLILNIIHPDLHKYHVIFLHGSKILNKYIFPSFFLIIHFHIKFSPHNQLNKHSDVTFAAYIKH